MKFIHSFIYITILSFFLACSSNKDNEQYSLHIDFINSIDGYAYLYGFFGDNQILVDSIQIKDAQINYPISKTCNTGVYRIILKNNNSFDFIYNKEDIEITIDTSDILHSITIKKSRENLIFYDFLKEMNLFEQSVQSTQSSLQSMDSTQKKKKSDVINKKLIDSYISIFSKRLTNKEISSTFAFSIIKSYNILHYDQYTIIHPNDSISEIQFLLKKCFTDYDFSDPRLLATPYLYSIINNYIESVKTIAPQYLPEAYSVLLSKASKQQAIFDFMQRYFYEYTYTMHNFDVLQSYLQHIYGNQIDFILKKSDTSFFTKTFIGYGIKAKPINGLDFSFANYTVLIFTDSTHISSGILTDLLNKNKQSFETNQIQPMVITPQKNADFNSLCEWYSIAAIPSIVIVDKQGNVTSRTFGNDNCKQVIEHCKLN